MGKHRCRALLFWLLLASSLAADTPQFQVIVLGVAGGLDESNLSAYLVAPARSSAFLALDAGSLWTGLHRAASAGSLRGVVPPNEKTVTGPGWMLKNGIKAYLISHPHLDHVSGLYLNSPEDSPKPILGIDSTLDAIRDHIFNWKTWANFANQGKEIPLRKYTYQCLSAGEKTSIVGSSMVVTAYDLSHAGESSTAFLLESGGSTLLYCGDTGPDAVEKSDKLAKLWDVLVPLIKSKSLKAIFIEVSYPDGRPDSQLFGHLTPRWLFEELTRLATKVDPENRSKALRGLPVVITHIKPSTAPGPSPRTIIARQLAVRNDLGIRIVLAQQGQKLDF